LYPSWRPYVITSLDCSLVYDLSYL
jgi:hypothetical protein